MKKRIRIAQQFLKEKGFYTGDIDGIAGPNTSAGFGRVEGINQEWPKSRQLTGIIQMAAAERGIHAGPVDGFWGPQTQFAFDELNFLLDNGRIRPPWRNEELVRTNRNNWPVQHSGEFVDLFGEKGSQLVVINLPYELKLAWQLTDKVRRTSCNSKVADSVGRVLQKVKEIYGENEINRLRLNHFGGCYNDRLIRGGTKWSMHAWGVALDFDPNRNKLAWGRDRASLAHPDYDDWWQCWEEEGWTSLGRHRNFDWMHIQAANL